MPSFKRQKSSKNDGDDKKPKMVRAKSKNLEVPDGKLSVTEAEFREKFQSSLIDRFVTKEEVFAQFQQNDEKQYEDDDDF